MAGNDRRKSDFDFLLAVAKGRRGAAAKKCGLGERTAYRRAAEGEFQKQVKELRNSDAGACRGAAGGHLHRQPARCGSC